VGAAGQLPKRRLARGALTSSGIDHLRLCVQETVGCLATSTISPRTTRRASAGIAATNDRLLLTRREFATEGLAIV
jgi:hypothetical protein